MKGDYWAKTYDPDYHPKKMIELAQNGYTYVQTCAEFGISVSTFKRWRDNHPEFKEAVEIAQVNAQAHEERILDGIAQGEIEGSANAQIFKMKSRFKEDYGEVKTVHNKHEVEFKNLPDEQLNKMLWSKIAQLPSDERKQLKQSLLQQGITIDITPEQIDTKPEKMRIENGS